QTLRAAIDWSCELLSPEEQTLFLHLSVFAGPFGLEAVERIADWGLGIADWEPGRENPQISQMTQMGRSLRHAESQLRNADCDSPNPHSVPTDARRGAIPNPHSEVLDLLAGLVDKSL